MKKTLKSFLSMSLIVAIVSTLLLPTQAQAKTKSLVADKDKVNVLDAIEAFENSGLDQILMPVSVGQTAHLLFNYNGEIVKSSKVKWKVIEGKDCVKVVKKGKLYKGVKPGDAVIQGTYKDSTIKFGVTVYEKTTVKAQKVKLDNVSVKIPKNYVPYTYLGSELTYLNTKKESYLAITSETMEVSADDVTEEEWAIMDANLSQGLLNIDISSFGMDSFGFIVDNDATIRELKYADHGTYVLKVTCPAKNCDDMVFGVAVFFKKNKLVVMANVSYDDELCEEELDYIIKNN